MVCAFSSGAAVAELAPDDGFVGARAGFRGRGSPGGGDGPTVGTHVACFLFARGTGLAPRDDAFHLRVEVVLRAVFVAEIGTVDGDGGKNLEDAVDEDPAAAASLVWVDGLDHVALFEADEVGHEVRVHVMVTKDVDVGSFAIGDRLAAGLSQNLVGGGGLLEREG